MKSQTNIAYFVASLFLLLTLVSCSHESANRHGDMVLHAQAEALYAKIILTELRDGHSTNAMELLEAQIDTCVIMIDHSLSSLSGTERDQALGTLRSLKAYREAHPRRREAVLQDAERQDTETLFQASQSASRILNNLK